MAQYPSNPHPSPLRVPSSAACLGRCFTSSREVISPPGISVLKHSFQCFIELGAKLTAFPLLSRSATVQVFTIYCWHLWQCAQPRHASEGHREGLPNTSFWGDLTAGKKHDQHSMLQLRISFKGKEKAPNAVMKTHKCWIPANVADHVLPTTASTLLGSVCTICRRCTCKVETLHHWPQPRIYSCDKCI